MVLDSSIHARRQRRKRWNRIYSDGARGAGSLRGALTGNDARLTVMARELGGSVEGTRDNHQCVVRVERIWQSLAESRFKWPIQVIPSDLMNLRSFECCHPARIIENLSDDFSWGSVALQFDRDEVALGVQPKKVDRPPKSVGTCQPMIRISGPSKAGWAATRPSISSSLASCPRATGTKPSPVTL
jgi:hypothetical protein